MGIVELLVCPVHPYCNGQDFMGTVYVFFRYLHSDGYRDIPILPSTIP
jgi:predicted CoA-binding protein